MSRRGLGNQGSVKKMRVGPDIVAQLVQCLPSMDKALGFSQALNKLGVVDHTYNPHTWEVEAGTLAT